VLRIRSRQRWSLAARARTTETNTVFLCNYLRQEPLRREIHEGLNVIENWNSANNFILYGKGGEFASNKLEDQEILMLSLHLLQVSLVYVRRS
jgi:TnpA family transposase